MSPTGGILHAGADAARQGTVGQASADHRYLLIAAHVRDANRAPGQSLVG